MKGYRIESKGGVVLGRYAGNTREEAMLAMAEETGLTDEELGTANAYNFVMVHHVPQRLLAKDLKLADVVRLDEDAFPDAIVERVTETEVHFFRPYMAHAGFEYAGAGTADGKEDRRLISYTGHSMFTVPRDSMRRYNVMRRDELRYEGSGLPPTKESQS